MEQTIETFITKPTADLLCHAAPSTAESPLVPWLLKIDWLLNLILRTLATMHPEGIVLPEVASLNISGGGIGFETTRVIDVGNRLSLMLILPPFAAVRAEAIVVAVTPVKCDRPRWHVSTEFTAISADDRERLIRHILQTQAERLRERRTGAG
ncbi:MAG: PilZ domain-containing protein [Nitrospirota bacterium]